MLDEAREVLAARLRIRAVVVGDSLHSGMGLSIVFVEDIFGSPDVGGGPKRIPRRRKAFRVMAPMHLHQTNVEVASPVGNEEAERLCKRPLASGKRSRALSRSTSKATRGRCKPIRSARCPRGFSRQRWCASPRRAPARRRKPIHHDARSWQLAHRHREPQAATSRCARAGSERLPASRRPPLMQSRQ